MLRGYGADPALVPRPGIDPDDKHQEWIAGRSRHVKLPMWNLDYLRAVLEQIPVRHDRPRGRPPDAATEELGFWLMGGGSVAETAKFVETFRARREEQPADNENLTDEERKIKKVEMEATIKPHAPKSWRGGSTSGGENAANPMCQNKND